MNQLYFIMTVLFSLILGANAFSYKDAKNWGKKYPECNGKHQSPISMNVDVIQDHSTNNQSLIFTDFHKMPKKLTVKNTGHTVEVKADWSGEPPTCTGGPLHGLYVFEKVSFYWPKEKWNDWFRSKSYTIPEYTFDLEMQMHFYRKDLKSFDKAQAQKGGLVAFKTELYATDHSPDHLLDNVEKNLHKVKFPNSTAEIPPFRLASYFVDKRRSYVFYEGSLEYPPCWESVTWFIDETSTDPSISLVNEFMKIKLAEGDVSNLRSEQPLNNRQVKQVHYQAKN